MAIEFYCGSCQSLLKTADSAVGKEARCPNCGSVQMVPPESESIPVAGIVSGNPQADSAGIPTPKSAGELGTGSPYAPPKPPANWHAEAYGQPPAIGRLSYRQAKARLTAPAIILIIVNAMGLLLWLIALIGGVMEIANGGADEEDIASFAILGCLAFLHAFSIFGAVMMLSMRHYRICLAASVTCMLSGLCCVLSLGFGIWALVVLIDEEVKCHFR